MRCSPWLENIVAVQTRHPKAARSKRRFLVGSDRSGARLHFPLPPSEYLVFRVLSPRKRWGNRRFANSPIDIPILEGKCAPSERVPLLDFHGLPPKSSAQSKRGGSGPADIPLFNGEPTRVDTLKSPAVAYESLGLFERVKSMFSTWLLETIPGIRLREPHGNSCGVRFPSPSGKAPRRTKINLTAHPVPRLVPAPVTYRPQCLLQCRGW